MSQTMLPPTMEPSPVHDPPPGSSRPEFGEFEYRPVPMLATISLCLGIAAFIALIGPFGLMIALLGIVLSAVTLLRIRWSRGQLGGGVTTSIGLALSSVFLFSGAYLQYSDYVGELPPGYLRVNFPREIAEKQFVTALYEGYLYDEVRLDLHPDVEPFVDQKIFVKGYMWQTKRQTGLDSFVLLKDNGECCFGGDPKPHDMIVVQLQDGKTTNAVNGLVAVAGTLRFDPHGGPNGQPLYLLEAEHCQQARTVF